MRQRSLINRLRGHIADRLGIKSEDAASGRWWEIDLLIVIFGGAIIYGLGALMEL